MSAAQSYRVTFQDCAVEVAKVMAVLAVGIPWVVSAWWTNLTPTLALIGFHPVNAVYATWAELVCSGIIVIAITVGWGRYSLAQRYPESFLAQVIALTSFLSAAWELVG